MRLVNASSSNRRAPILGSLTRRRGRFARMFPEEAERLATPAELKRLYYS